jgi:hypothetical protein
LPYVVLIAAFILALGVGVERLLARLGIRPVEDRSSRGGVAMVADALERWAEKRKR